MLKLAILTALALAAFGTSVSQTWQGHPVTDTITFVLRLRNEYYNLQEPQEKLVKNLKGCAQFCNSQLDCVAFNCGPVNNEILGPSRLCSLIFVKDLNRLASLGITSGDGVNYYEMDCHQFCDRHNAELKLLACAPLNVGITLLTLPTCKCESIKPNCGILG